MNFLPTCQSPQIGGRHISHYFILIVLLLVLLPITALTQPKDKDKKIIICHHLPDNPDKTITLEIGLDELQEHLDHGDYIGSCMEGNGDGIIIPYYVPPGGKIEEEIGAELTSLQERFKNVGSVPSDDIYTISKDRVLIEIIVKNNDDPGAIKDLIDDLKTNYNAEVYEDYRNVNDFVITVLFPIDNLDALNDYTLDPDIISFVRPAYTPILKSGLINSQGDIAIQSDNAREAFGVSGKNVSVCVMSDSYDAKGKALKDIANGDLPPNVFVLKDYPSEFGSHFYVVDEGSAMLQIVHDVAPDADLAFRTGFFSIEDMAQGIYDLYDNENTHCDIIVDDITHLAEPFFTDGLIAQAVNDVANWGVKYFSSAGNFADHGFEGQFSPMQVNDEEYHNFGIDGINQQVYFGKGTYIIVLQWKDVYKSLGGVNNEGADNDLDMSLVDESGNILVALNSGNIGGDPIEVMPFKVEEEGAYANIQIKRAYGDTPNLEFKYIVFLGTEFQILRDLTRTSTIVGQANAAGAYAVGAALFSNTPAFGVDPPTIASFSSYGGNLIDGVDRKKPDFVAPNGVNTSINLGGENIDGDIFPNFFGTSAAAPHAAAVAALLIDAKSKFHVEFDVGEKMKETAIDMETSGYDVRSGEGFIMADAAIMTFASPKPVLTELVVPTDVIPGVKKFTLTVKGKNLTEHSKVIFDDVTLPANKMALVNSTELTVAMPEFTGDPALLVENPPLTEWGDGGLSNALYFSNINRKTITVTANDHTKFFGELNPSEFIVSLLVNDVPLDPVTHADDYEILNVIEFEIQTSANAWNSPTGIYFIRPIGILLEEGDPDPTEDYDFKYVDGYLEIGQLPLTIKPVIPDFGPEGIHYGDIIEEVDFIYDLYSDNSDGEENNENIWNLQALLNYISNEHRSTFPEDITNALVDRARFLVNRGRFLVNQYGSWLVSDAALQNRARFLVNGDVAINVIDIFDNLIEDYSENPDGSIIERARFLVNGESLYNGDANVWDVNNNKARFLVNEGGLGETEEGGQAYADINIIMDEIDNTISKLYSINLISGLDVNEGNSEFEGAPQYIKPGAFISPAAANFDISYMDEIFDILPAELSVTAEDKWIINGDPLPEFGTSVYGRAYNETSEIIFSSISYEPTNYTGIGHYEIMPSPTFNVPSNYTLLDENIQNGTLTVADFEDLKYLVSTSEGIRLVDALGSSTILINTPNRDVEIYKDIIYVLTSDFNIEKYDRQGQLIETITLPDEVSQNLNPGQYLGLVIIPNSDIALLDNRDDKIYFINSQGEYLNSVNILETPDFHLQNMDGVVKGNHLIVSNDGNNKLIDVNLESYEVSDFRDLSHLDGSLGAIDYYNGTYYICQSTKIWSFIENSPGENLIASLPDNNITGILVTGDYAYVTINHFSRVYKVNIGAVDDYQIFSENLLQAADIEALLPVYSSSPENGKIAISAINNSSVWELLIVNSDGTNPIVLYSGVDKVRDPHFSPDGNEIVFTLESAASSAFNDLWKINTDGTGLTQLTTDNISKLGNFSPDGTLITYVYRNHYIAVINSDGTNQTTITPMSTTGSLLWPTYSPDGQEIYYTKHYTVGIGEDAVGLNNIYKVNVNTLVVTQITDATIFHRKPDISPDGTRIVYTRALKSGADGNAVFSMNTNGNDVTLLHQPTTGSIGDANYSPDGQKLAFYMSGILYTMNVDGTNIQEIYNQVNHFVLQPSWGTYPDEPWTMFIPESMTSSTIQGDFTIYPNPVIDILTIDHNNVDIKAEHVSVAIYNNVGLIDIDTTPFDVGDEIGLDLSLLTPGMYFLHISDGQKVEQFTILKE